MSSLWSRLLGHAPEPDEGTERWRSTLRAAARVPFYARWKRELHRAQHAAGEESRREALLRLPVVELDYFFQHFRLFREKDAAPGKPRDARCLWPGDTRIAVVCPWFHVGAGVKLLLKPAAGELRKQAPEVIAAPVDALETLALACEWTQDTSLFAVVALVGVGTPLLGQAARERLWRAFGVPVYVQLRGFQGELLARECEAHNGLHYDAGGVFVERRADGELLLTSLANQRHTVLRLASRLEAWLDMRVCECGLASPRLMDLRAATGGAGEHSLPSERSLSALAAAVGEGQPRSVEPPVPHP